MGTQASGAAQSLARCYMTESSQGDADKTLGRKGGRRRPAGLEEVGTLLPPGMRPLEEGMDPVSFPGPTEWLPGL